MVGSCINSMVCVDGNRVALNANSYTPDISCIWLPAFLVSSYKHCWHRLSRVPGHPQACTNRTCKPITLRQLVYNYDICVIMLHKLRTGFPCPKVPLQRPPPEKCSGWRSTERHRTGRAIRRLRAQDGDKVAPLYVILLLAAFTSFRHDSTDVRCQCTGRISGSTQPLTGNGQLMPVCCTFRTLHISCSKYVTSLLCLGSHNHSMKGSTARNNVDGALP